jgi:hypothetical protein
MTDDLIESTFADLDSYYPGSKRKRKPIVAKTIEAGADVAWDSTPIKKTLPNGRDIEMFTIGALAAAVGRPVVSIRAWITQGYLPASPYRLPTKKDVNGKDHAGRRLYSRAMVEKLVEILDKAGLLHTKRIEWPLHRQISLDIAEAWSNIRATENNDN